MDKNQRYKLSDGLFNLAGLAFTGLVIGQFVTDEFRLGIFVGGITFVVIIFITATLLAKEEE